MDLPARFAAARSPLVGASADRLGIDTRSLAAFRIAVGLLVLADLLRRARNLEAFYTDVGVLPRTALLTRSNSLHLSLHTISGEVWFQAALFALAGAFAVALTVGYLTPIATVGSWLMLVSLHNRNGLLLNGGDVLLRLLLFWAIFLPLAARWSVDAQRSNRARTRVVGVASAALLLQVVIMYSTNAALKLSGDRWLAGEALAYVFSLGQFTVLLGDVLASYPALLVPLEYLWLALVAGSFLLIVLPGWWRIGLVALFVGMHLGMLFTMRLDLFPLISIAGLLPFLPGAFWDAVLPRLSRYRHADAVGRAPATLAAVLPTVTVSGVPAGVRRARAALATFVPLVFLVLVVLWNVQFLGYTEVYGHDVLPEEAEPAIEITRTDQYWNMFAPDPLSTDGWIVAPGRLVNGSHVDAFHGGAVRWERPADISSTYPSPRWRKYLVRLWRYDTSHRERFAAYLCRHWNARHDTRLENVSVYFMEQPSRPYAETEPIERVHLADQRC